jgi:hypothetical protein
MPLQVRLQLKSLPSRYHSLLRFWPHCYSLLLSLICESIFLHPRILGSLGVLWSGPWHFIALLWLLWFFQFSFTAFPLCFLHRILVALSHSQLYPFSFVLYDFGLAIKSQFHGLILFSVVAHATSFTGTHSIWTQMLERSPRYAVLVSSLSLSCVMSKPSIVHILWIWSDWSLLFKLRSIEWVRF